MSFLFTVPALESSERETLERWLTVNLEPSQWAWVCIAAQGNCDALKQYETFPWELYWLVRSCGLMVWVWSLPLKYQIILDSKFDDSDLAEVIQSNPNVCIVRDPLGFITDITGDLTPFEQSEDAYINNTTMQNFAHEVLWSSRETVLLQLLIRQYLAPLYPNTLIPLLVSLNALYLSSKVDCIRYKLVTMQTL